MRESAYNIWVDDGESSFVYNGVSGGVLQMGRETRRHVQALCGSGDLADIAGELPVSTVQDMALGQMLVPDDVDEVAKLAERYRSSRFNEDMFALTIVTSLGCNFDCPYCFEAKEPSVLAPAVQDMLVAVVRRKLARAQSFHVCWFGGEPLLGRDALFSLSARFQEAARAAEVSYDASIITNGYLLDLPTAERLVAADVRFAQITLDGPPEHHNLMRPLVSGRPTFDRILENILAVHEVLPIMVRVNVDRANVGAARRLLELLADNGLAGKVGIALGQLVGVDPGVAAPSLAYAPSCLSRREFARAETEFLAAAQELGFASPSVPDPIGTPCTAVRSNDMVIGSRGELYKCWETVGSPPEIVGHITDFDNVNGRAAKWLSYDPFSDEECRQCIALPVCMGGCAQHAFDPVQHENRCDSFRENYLDRVRSFVTSAPPPAEQAFIPAASLTYRMDGR